MSISNPTDRLQRASGLVVVNADGSVSISPGAGVGIGLGANFTDIAQIAAPANPSAGTRRLFVDSGSGELSVRTSGGVTVSLESGGGGGGGYATIQEEGVSVTARTVVNFIGGCLTAADNPGATRTDVSQSQTRIRVGVGLLQAGMRRSWMLRTRSISSGAEWVLRLCWTRLLTLTSSTRSAMDSF